MRRSPSTLFLLAWLVAGATATYSVVRYELWIVLVYTALTAALLTWQVRRGTVDLTGRWPVPAALVGAAVVAEAVPFWTFVTPGERRWLAHGVALTCLVSAALWAADRGWSHRAALGAAVTGYLATAATAVVIDPAPRIDVWVTLQQASDHLARGDNFYAVTWVGSPGIKDAFTYLPWTAVVLAPGRWLVGDVRWALIALTLLAVAATVALGRWRAPAAVAAALLLLLTPGTVTQVEQAWTEPLLLACLAGWALLVSRDRAWLAVVPLALGCASKQHLALLLPVLAAWPQFGVRRAVATGGLTGVLIAPWFLASPADFWHDTVSLLVSFPPLRFADTLFIAARTELGWTPPFYVTGVLVLGTIAAAAWVVRRRDPDLGEVLRWLAVVLLVANVLNKQAFYNQYWLVLSLVVLSLAVPTRTAEVTPPAARPARAAA